MCIHIPTIQCSGISAPMMLFEKGGLDHDSKKQNQEDPCFATASGAFTLFDGYKWRGKGDMQPKRPELKVNNRFNSKEVKQKREIHGNPTIFKLKEMVYKSCSFTV